MCLARCLLEVELSAYDVLSSSLQILEQNLRKGGFECR